MLGLSGVLVRLLAFVVTATSDDVTVRTERAYLSCQPGGEALVCFQVDSVQPWKLLHRVGQASCRWFCGGLKKYAA